MSPKNFDLGVYRDAELGLQPLEGLQNDENGIISGVRGKLMPVHLARNALAASCPAE